MNTMAFFTTAVLFTPLVTLQPARASHGRPQRPTWAAEGVPDTVWILLQEATEVDDQDLRRSLLQEAEVRARAAVEGHEKDVGRRYALAAVLGLQANTEGGRAQVRAAGALYGELEAILTIEPNHAGARHMLGRLHAAVCRMSRVKRWVATKLLGGDVLKEASWEVAEENLVFAEREAPEVPDHHLQLALLYRDTGRPELAAEELSHVLEMQAVTAVEVAARSEAMELWRHLGA